MDLQSADHGVHLGHVQSFEYLHGKASAYSEIQQLAS